MKSQLELLQELHAHLADAMVLVDQLNPFEPEIFEIDERRTLASLARIVENAVHERVAMEARKAEARIVTSERSGLIVADRVEPGRKAVPWGRRNRFRRPILSLSPDRSPASGPRPGVRDDSQRIYLPGSVRSFEEWTVDGGRWTEFLHCPPSTVHFLPPCPILPLAAYFAGPIVTVIGPPPRIRQRRVNRRGRHNRYAACGLIEPRQGCLSMTALLVKLPNVGNLYQYGQGRGCTPGPRFTPWRLASGNPCRQGVFIRGGISPRRGPRPHRHVCRRPPARGFSSVDSGQCTVDGIAHCPPSTVHLTTNPGEIMKIFRLNPEIPVLDLARANVGDGSLFAFHTFGLAQRLSAGRKTLGELLNDQEPGSYCWNVHYSILHGMMLLDWVLCEEDQEANLIIEQTLREHRETAAPSFVAA